MSGTHKYYDYGGSVSNAYIKVLQDGIYLILASGSYKGVSATSGGVGYLRFTIDGNTTTINSQQTSSYTYGLESTRPHLIAVKHLSAGQIVRLETAALANGVLKSKGEEHMTIFKLF